MPRITSGKLLDSEPDQKRYPALFLFRFQDSRSRSNSGGHFLAILTLQLCQERDRDL